MQAQFLTPGTVVINTPTSWYLPAGTIESVTFAYDGAVSHTRYYRVRFENDRTDYIIEANSNVATANPPMPLVDSSDMTMIEFMICSLINDEQEFDSVLFNSPYDIPARMSLSHLDEKRPGAMRKFIVETWIARMVRHYTDQLRGQVS